MLETLRMDDGKARVSRILVLQKDTGNYRHRMSKQRERENDKRYITYILRKKIAEIPGARHHKGGLRKRKLHVTYGEQAR